MDSGTIRDSLVRVDALVGLLTIEEIGDELDDTRDTSGSTNQNDFVNVGLVDLGIPKDLLNRLECASEQVLAQLLETGASEGSVEIDTLEKGIDLDGSLGSGRESALSAFTSGSETPESTGV